MPLPQPWEAVDLGQNLVVLFLDRALYLLDHGLYLVHLCLSLGLGPYLGPFPFLRADLSPDRCVALRGQLGQPG